VHKKRYPVNPAPKNFMGISKEFDAHAPRTLPLAISKNSMQLAESL
jgi:hypothetical protein